MAFKRSIEPAQLLVGDELGRAMAGIGMALAVEPNYGANIEGTLLSTSFVGIEGDQLRELSLLTTWWEVHAPIVNADRLYALASKQTSERLRAYWVALSRQKSTDPRFRRFAALAKPNADVHLLRVGSAFQLARRGEDVRFAGGPLRVPEGVLRARVSDVHPPKEVARHHRAYRARLLMGPSCRVDMWAALEVAPTLSLSELARATYGSIATASRVKNDRALWLSALEGRTLAEL